MNELGIYIHIPFCKKKCYYCDFISFENKNEFIDEYVEVIKREIINESKNIDKDYQINTIYIGGGTPSIISSEHIESIINTIKDNFNVIENAEITIEINPGTYKEEKMKKYIKMGINRISIGLQTTEDKLLKNIGRIHSYDDFLTTYNMARKSGFKNINVDLMLGLPNQNLKDLEVSLNKVISLNPEHISVYSLIVEDETPIKKMLDKKILKLPNEETERSMYWKVKEILENEGYIHYEISNFAKQGFESKHNINCWEQKEYLGFGLAAHSYLNNIRYCNIDNIENYIKNGKQDKWKNNKIICEEQSKIDKQKEFMLLGLRKIKGISISEFKNRFIENPLYVYHKELEKLVKEELIEIDGDYIKLTLKGLDFANIVWEEFV